MTKLTLTSANTNTTNIPSSTASSSMLDSNVTIASESLCYLSRTLYHNLKDIFSVHGKLELIVAYSGGVDSQVLLHALTALKQQSLINNPITVCHVNHGLSANAEHWQQFAKQACRKLSVNLIVKSVSIKATAQQSLEALARDARYDVLKNLRNPKSIVLTGHHSDDQSETFLLALKRGAGLKGLSAMSVQTDLGKHVLARPLLNISRQAIERYAKAHSLSWVEDESNSDTVFDRNFIRQTIMPLLRERWPSINKTINRSASHCADGQELLDELAQQDLSACGSTDNGLYVEDLINLSAARFNNLIRYYIEQHPYYDCLMPSTEQLKQVREQLQAAADKTPQIKVADHFFRRFKGILYLTPNYQDISQWQQVIKLTSPEWYEQGNNQLEEQLTVVLPDKLGQLVFSKSLALSPDASEADISEHDIHPLDPMFLLPASDAQMPRIKMPEATQQVSIRFNHNNPKCLPHFRQKSRALKKVLQELAIAPWLRKRIAFLYYDDELVAALGYFVCQPYIVNERQPALGIAHYA